MPRRAAVTLLIMLLAAAALAAVACDEPEAVTNPDTTTLEPAAPAVAYTYSFAVMGDSHTDGLDNGVLGRAMESAVANGAQFIVHTGDVSNIGASEELERYHDFIATAGVPVYSIPGNHDIVSSGDTSLFAAVVGPPWASFDHAGDHFVLIDYSDEANGIGAGQIDWLAGDLAANASARHQFIFSHIPLLEAEQVPPQYLGEPAVQSGHRLLELTQSQGNIAAYFSGHIHGSIKFRIGGVDAWISGGAGATPYPSAIIGFYHYLLVRVENDRVDVQVVRL